MISPFPLDKIGESESVKLAMEIWVLMFDLSVISLVPQVSFLLDASAYLVAIR